MSRKINNKKRTQLYTIGECVETIIDNRGKTPPVSKMVTPFELLEVNSLANAARYPDYSVVKKYLDEDTYFNWFRNGHPKKNDILFSTVGSIAETALSEGRGSIAQNLIALRIDKLKAIPAFFYYFLKNPQIKNQLLSLDISSVQPSIKVPHLLSLEIHLPSIPEQKSIASILSSLDDKIDLLHRQNKTLESLAETLFRQWFVEEADEQMPVSECIDFNPQRVIPKGLATPYLEMSNVNTNIFHPIDWCDREFRSGMKFINRDTLLARITPCLENGKAAYVTFLEDGQTGWGSTEFIGLRPKGNIHPLLAYALTKNQDFRDYAEGCLEGSSGRQRVNVDHLMNFEINLLTKDRINGFNRAMESIEPKLVNNFAGIRTLEQLRDVLLPRLVSGEVEL
jgi:type I restriction enzyme S subunit